MDVLWASVFVSFLMIIGDRRSIKDSFNFSIVNPVVVVQAAAINITA